MCGSVCVCWCVCTGGVFSVLSHRGPGVRLSSLFPLFILVWLMSPCSVVQSDVSSTTQDGSVTPAGQDVGPKVGYLGTTGSSRAKLCQSTEEKLPSDLLAEGHDLLGSRVEPLREQSRYASEATPGSVSSAGFYISCFLCSASSRLRMSNQKACRDRPRPLM